MERTMKLQDVILEAMAKKISWMEAAEIAGVTDRTMRRIRDRYEEFGYTGLFESEAGQEEHAPDPDGDGGGGVAAAAADAGNAAAHRRQ
jgi:hypothetical protein